MLKYVVPKFPVEDIQASLEFYNRKMGFAVLFDYGEYAAVKRDSVEIHLWECHDKYIAENTACRVAVDDIEALYTEYSQAGIIHPNGILEEKPWGLREFVTLDLDGNGIFFFNEGG